MAYQYLTMLDLAKINKSDQAVGLIEENLNSAPEAMVLPARTIVGTSYKTLVRTDYARGSFRSPNSGVEPTKSTYVNKQFETFYYDGQMEMDNAIATGDDQGVAHALALEADGHGRGYLLQIGKQVWYGINTINGDALGFPGALQSVDSSLVVDAGGTTDSVASSVWAVVADPRFMGLTFGNSTVLQVGEWRKQSVTRSSKEMTAWKNSLEGWIGIEALSKYAFGRIKKLTTDSGKGLTDTLLSQLIANFPVGVKPTHLFMTRRSRQQLQASRTVTLFGQGSGKPSGAQATIAPVPTEYDGIPIIATDSILNTETLAL